MTEATTQQLLAAAQVALSAYEKARSQETLDMAIAAYEALRASEQTQPVGRDVHLVSLNDSAVLLMKRQ
jgi:predicted component of type VI protein secretion system